MLDQKKLFAKALLVDKTWFVLELKFDQNAGKPEIWIDFERGSLYFSKKIKPQRRRGAEKSLTIVLLFYKKPINIKSIKMEYNKISSGVTFEKWI